ncbi:putative ribonuclease H-like domain-containing protein, partial [Tanacetum coccineum]
DDSNDEPQPSNDAGKKDDEGGIYNQERPKKISTALHETSHADFFGDETELDMSNITTTYSVSSTPNTRIHKDHLLDHVIGRAQEGNPSIKRSKLDRSYAGRAFSISVYNGLDLWWIYTMAKEPIAKAVAQGYTQEEGIDYDEVFAPVARIESNSIRLFLAYALFKDFVAYTKLEEFPSEFRNGFQRGTIDKTLFIKKVKSDILLVQVYVDDIIFGSIKKELCTEFEKLMHNKFQMSSIGELTFFLGLQVTQKDDGIFISQDKYADEILKKFGFSTVKTASTPMETSKPLMKDENAEDVDVHLYRSMIGSLMYLTSSRPDIMFAVCACARFQVTPKVLHLHAVKRIFRYLKDRKSTTGGCQFLGSRLISWQCKKQTIVANSTTKAEYVAAASCCRQIQALVDGKKVIVTETSVRRALQLKDAEGTECLPNVTIFEQLTLMGNFDLENTKTSQAAEITKLKVEGSRSWKGRNKSRTLGLKRLRKVGRSAQVVSSEDEGLGAQEDASKHERKINDLDADAEVTLVDEAQGRNDDNLMFDTRVLDEQEVRVEKAVSTAEVTTVSATTITVDELTLA